jgi:hypothetical protein
MNPTEMAQLLLEDFAERAQIAEQAAWERYRKFQALAEQICDAKWSHQHATI